MPLQASRVLKQFKYAMYFDGVDDYVKVPNFLFSEDFTINLWVYPLLYGNMWATYFGNADVFGRYNLWMRNNLYRQAPNAELRWFGTDKNEYGISVGTFSNWWNNIAVTKSNLTFVSYLNAVIKQSYIAPYDINYATIDLVIAYPNGYGSGFLKGFISQFLIYSRALSNSEIQWNYLYPDNPVRNGLVLWLQADLAYVKDIDNDGILEWIDLSGFGNHGKIYGAQLVQLIKSASRVIQAQRVLACAR